MTAIHHVGPDGSVSTAFSDQEATIQVAVEGRSYTEYDRRPGLSFGMYHLAAGMADPQSPHTEDEIYVVAAGRGAIELDGVAHAIGPGSVISVPRHVVHEFVDITEDLSLVVVFGPPEGALADGAE
jgi:mannose-6-phosphate isomerase-like protein (cupin superfamily)